jgi:leader peptidase (prepilin peptidase)/N-methyltransferase
MTESLAVEASPLLSLLFDAPPGILAAAVVWGLVGLLVGSFLNVVIHRIPVMLQRETDNFIAMERDDPPPHTTRYNLVVPRSACPSCGHTLSAAENIPVVSWLWLRGRCRHCRATRPARYSGRPGKRRPSRWRSSCIAAASSSWPARR